MPLIAKTPREAFHTFQDHLNRTLNKVLTPSRLRFIVRSARQEKTSLAFFDARSRPVAVRLPSSFWYLSLRQDLQAVPGKEGYELRTLQYAYRIQRTPSIQDEAEVRFEYVSHELDPSARWCRHHVQFHRDYQNVRDSFSPNKLHIPTGSVTVEDVIRFLITDLGVPPLIETWDGELKKSEEQFRVWTSRDVPA